MDRMLGKVFQVIETLAGSDRPRGVNELARSLKLPASNVHRILRSLIRLRYVQQDASLKSYSLTPRLFEVGMAIGGRLDLKLLARPAIEQLAAETREAVGLTILEQHDVVYIDHVDSTQPIRMFQTLGHRVPAFCSAGGRAILALHPEGEEIVRSARREAFTPRTVTDAAEIVEQLRRVKRQGYSIVMQERHERINGIAAPIVNRGGLAVASIGIFGLSDRLRLPVLRAYAPSLMAAAADVSQKLRGHLPLLAPG